MQIIDKKTFKKINQYNYFKTFDDPTYGFNVKIDVTNLVKYKNEKKISFFIPFLYLTTLAMNNIYEFHLREINNEIVYFETINPTYTVIGNNGVYYNTRNDLRDSFKVFYKETRKNIDLIKNKTDIDLVYNDEDYAVYYMTCVPTISILGMNHPTPSKNYTSSSVPRVLWDKYYLDKNDNHYYLTLNITVSHCFIDGYPLSAAFIKLNEMLNNLDKYLDL